MFKLLQRLIDHWQGVTTHQQGLATAPAAAGVIVAGVAMTAGIYDVYVNVGFSGAGAAGKGAVIEHRNAADTAVVGYLGYCPVGQAQAFVVPRVTFAANERVRVVQGAVAAAASEVVVARISLVKRPA